MKLTVLMESEPHPCGYLPDRLAVHQETLAFELNPSEYRQLVDHGFRRFGRGLFRPKCPSCQKCIPIRIPVRDFCPSRSQKRNLSQNAPRLDLQIEMVSQSEDQKDHLANLHQKFHLMQSGGKGWPNQSILDSSRFVETMVEQPFPVEVWNYLYKGEVVGSGYVDALPDGLSAIYFIHDPKIRAMGPGIFNVLSLIEGARTRGLDFLFLGFWVPGSASMAYKANFSPAEILAPKGQWIPLDPKNMVDPF